MRMTKKGFNKWQIYVVRYAHDGICISRNQRAKAGEDVYAKVSKQKPPKKVRIQGTGCFWSVITKEELFGVHCVSVSTKF